MSYDLYSQYNQTREIDQVDYYLRHNTDVYKEKNIDKQEEFYSSNMSDKFGRLTLRGKKDPNYVMPKHLQKVLDSINSKFNRQTLTSL